MIDLFTIWRKGRRKARPILTMLATVGKWGDPLRFGDKRTACVSVLLRVPRSAPFAESFVMLVMFKADQQPRNLLLCARIFVSFLIFVWIVVGFSAHIHLTNHTGFLRMITCFLFGG